MLARAFRYDPIIAYALPDEKEHKTKLPYVYEFLLSYNIRYAEAYATSERLEGVAIWQRHERKKSYMPFWHFFLS